MALVLRQHQGDALVSSSNGSRPALRLIEAQPVVHISVQNLDQTFSSVAGGKYNLPSFKPGRHSHGIPQRLAPLVGLAFTEPRVANVIRQLRYIHGVLVVNRGLGSLPVIISVTGSRAHVKPTPPLRDCQQIGQERQLYHAAAAFGYGAGGSLTWAVMGSTWTMSALPWPPRLGKCMLAPREDPKYLKPLWFQRNLLPDTRSSP